MIKACRWVKYYFQTDFLLLALISKQGEYRVKHIAMAFIVPHWATLFRRSMSSIRATVICPLVVLWICCSRKRKVQSFEEENILPAFLQPYKPKENTATTFKIYICGKVRHFKLDSKYCNINPHYKDYKNQNYLQIFKNKNKWVLGRG